jgi:hypothetical protein
MVRKLSKVIRMQFEMRNEQLKNRTLGLQWDLALKRKGRLRARPKTRHPPPPLRLRTQGLVPYLDPNRSTFI